MYRILIAEDDDNLRHALKDYFCNKGFKVHDADNGDKAIMLADTEEFDIAILDVMMPGTDGFKVCEHIRKTLDIPIIFLTARTAEEDQLHGFEVSAGTGCLEFWIQINGSYVVLSAPVETGVYYEAVGAYNGRTAVLYLNGEAVARKSCTGAIGYPATEGAHSFRIGADITADGGAEACFDGKITYAKAYGFGVTAKQVAKLYEAE